MSKENIKTGLKLSDAVRLIEENENALIKHLVESEKALQSENEKLKKSREVLRKSLKEISIEQTFYIKTKDYFSEVVRLNLEAREALKADSEIMEGK